MGTIIPRKAKDGSTRYRAQIRITKGGATIPQIQQISLHESWNSLSIYVNIPAKRQRRVDFSPSAARR